MALVAGSNRARPSSLAMATAAGSNRAASLKPHHGAGRQIELGRCGRVQPRHGRTIHGPGGRVSRAESNKGVSPAVKVSLHQLQCEKSKLKEL